MQATFETFARVAATFAVILIALVVLLTFIKETKPKVDYDWPFIVAYTLMFLCIGVMTYLRGFRIVGIATIAVALAIAVFDTLENLNAYDTDKLVPSTPKWVCYFVCVLLTAVLFGAASHNATRLIAGGLILSGLIGLVVSFLHRPTWTQGAAGLTMLAFLPAIHLFVRKPELLLP